MSIIKVSTQQCNECLFSSNKIVSNARRKQILAACMVQGKETFFICHKATIAGKSVCCREFYDRLGDRVALIQIAQRLNLIEFVDIETLEHSKLEKRKAE